MLNRTDTHNPIGTPAYSLIAYFDILGYKAFLDDPESDELELLESLKDTLSDLRQIANVDLGAGELLQLKAFSDNVVMALPCSDNPENRGNFIFLVLVLCLMQLKLISKYNQIIRGGLLGGKILIDDDLVFGEGLVKAVGMEEQAVFPRIVVDDSGLPSDMHTSDSATFLQRDSDGKSYLDFFRVLDHFEDQMRVRHLDRIRSNLEKRIRKHCRYATNVLDLKKNSSNRKHNSEAFMAN